MFKPAGSVADSTSDLCDLSDADTDTPLLHDQPITPLTPHFHPHPFRDAPLITVTDTSTTYADAPSKRFPKSNKRLILPLPRKAPSRGAWRRARRHNRVMREVIRLRNARFESWATMGIRLMARDAALVDELRTSVQKMERIAAERGVLDSHSMTRIGS
ncbi:hypothetical protein CC85DRAFT_19705 [Cutaneotrichosporon oleaginosum]|uniref:Uncharacterized protein n=1 Tax=Cutaneotrichosporon oleaginosum TaxID=879819 RepID=A0A0J0XCA6_9TREE|nr:uncharacterized protein CC85DRAFT_19705 [Cutaneotrichosporon oleaginosum]KLT38700.1 hypothetical protein CC85DRAFT_19705 [Cutaneotrichosporon oleaginosum]TXT07577.1 hypothetical protein COLE_04501 [Cutaneotrichosporon oleaginosum]